MCVDRRNVLTLLPICQNREKQNIKRPYKSITRTYNGRVMVGRYVRDTTEIYSISIADRKYTMYDIYLSADIGRQYFQYFL